MVRLPIKAAYAILALFTICLPASGQSLPSVDGFSLNPAPVEIPNAELSTLDGRPASLADYRGRMVLLNFWATWCAPCRHEMPSLSALQASIDDTELTVIALAFGRHDATQIRRFFADIGITNLVVLIDSQSRLARQMGVRFIPVTSLLNTAGEEVGRLTGPADWSSERAIQLIRSLMGPIET